ncbi:phage late control D family protein [Desulfurobacterium sp.]
MEKIRIPVWNMLWNGKNVTDYLTPYVLSVTYEDVYHGESDTIEITIENRDLRWLQSWYPEKGDTVVLNIGYKGEPHLPCGEFEIDEIEFSGSRTSGDTVHLRGIATQFKKSIREKRTIAYENTTLSKIVKLIAERNGMNAVIELDADPTFKRIDQKQKADLTFLRELAEKYNASVKVQGNTVYFISNDRLKDRKPALTIERKDVISYSLRDKTHNIYKGIIIAYHDPKTKKLLKYKEDWTGYKAGADYLKINEKVESLEEAKIRARAERHKYDSKEKTGRITMPGNSQIMAGLVVALNGFGLMNGNWLIERTRHTISRAGGWIVEMEVRKV